jgi:hypothetical protein
MCISADFSEATMEIQHMAMGEPFPRKLIDRYTSLQYHTHDSKKKGIK